MDLVKSSREKQKLLSLLHKIKQYEQTIKTMVDKSQNDPKCRICKQSNETISHIVSSCSKMAQKEYKRRHDNVATAIHWGLSGKCGFERKERSYDHVPGSVLENEDYKLLWDFSVRTDHEIGARRPDLVIIDKRDKSCQIIDVAIPEDNGVREKEDEKVEKYQDLAREVRKMWGVRTVVVGALGSIPLRLNDNLRAIEVGIPLGLIQLEMCIVGDGKNS